MTVKDKILQGRTYLGMEKIAIEKLGYAYPNERRFYIVNNSD